MYINFIKNLACKMMIMSNHAWKNKCGNHLVSSKLYEFWSLSFYSGCLPFSMSTWGFLCPYVHIIYFWTNLKIWVVVEGCTTSVCLAFLWGFLEIQYIYIYIVVLRTSIAFCVMLLHLLFRITSSFSWDAVVKMWHFNVFFFLSNK